MVEYPPPGTERSHGILQVFQNMGRIHKVICLIRDARELMSITVFDIPPFAVRAEQITSVPHVEPTARTVVQKEPLSGPADVSLAGLPESWCSAKTRKEASPRAPVGNAERKEPRCRQQTFQESDDHLPVVSEGKNHD